MQFARLPNVQKTSLKMASFQENFSLLPSAISTIDGVWSHVGRGIVTSGGFV